jgi:hypothetical protein
MDGCEVRVRFLIAGKRTHGSFIKFVSSPAMDLHNDPSDQAARHFPAFLSFHGTQCIVASKDIR